jgi:hypothetical protein
VAGDEGGAESAAGDARAESLDEIADLALAVATPHRLEHAAVDVLDRDIPPGPAGPWEKQADGVDGAAHYRRKRRLLSPEPK